MNWFKLNVGRALYYIRYINNLFVNQYLQANYYSTICSIGKNVKFNGICYIHGQDKISIGDNVHIGNNAWIKGEGGLYIGDNTHISRNLVLYTVNHNYLGKCLPYDNSNNYKKVIIEKNVWIGINVTILPGTYIEEGVIIGAGSVVTGRIKKLSIYGASIGKVINKRDENHYEFLEKNKRYGGVNGEKLF